MDHDAYRAGIGELYAAEVLGEGLASRCRTSSRIHFRCLKSDTDVGRMKSRVGTSSKLRKPGTAPPAATSHLSR
jgi:hypothetical protein